MAGLNYVTDYIRRIHGNLSRGSIPDERTGSFFFRRDEGTLFFSPPESIEYSQIVSRLVKGYAKSEDLSRRTIERHFQNAIFDALDVKSTRGGSFEHRLKEAVQMLHTTLSEKPTSHLCYIPVGGFAPDSFPSQIGPLRFVILNQSHVRRLSRGATPNNQTDTDRRSALAHLKEPDFRNRQYGMVKVLARDFDAAMYLARRETRRVLDILNFFASLSPFIHGWAFLAGEAASVKTAAPALRADGLLSVRYGVAGPLQAFSLKVLKDTRPLRRGLRRALKLLRDRPRFELADVLLASIQWAGRAAVEPRREQAFVLYVVALETIILPASDQRELAYRLRIRTAQLLEVRPEQRDELCNTIKRLYEIRSKIVHSGSYDVTDEDLAQLEVIVRRAILRIIHHRAICRFKRPKELDNWFERKVLH